MKKHSRKDSVDIFTLIKRNGLYYHQDNITLFTGYYHWYYPSGIIAEEGHMIKGYASGLIKLYSEEGGLLVEAEYSEGKKNGKVTTYYPSGHIKAVFFLINDKREGRMIIWYEGGNKKYEANYQNDMLNGKQTKYFSDGKINIECEYKNNLEHGSKKIIGEDGTLLFQGCFEEGELL